MQKKITQKKKKKKSTPHLDFYNRCVEHGNRLYKVGQGGEFGGLCSAAFSGLINEDLFEIRMIPTPQDKDRLRKKGRSTAYWGSNSAYDKWGELTPLRANIILFMAAIKGEL